MARDEVIGWNGLAPIAELIEYIFGIRCDYSDKKILCYMTLLDENIFERYAFCPDGNIALKVAKSRTADEKPLLTVDSNIPLDSKSSTESLKRK